MPKKDNHFNPGGRGYSEPRLIASLDPNLGDRVRLCLRMGWDGTGRDWTGRDFCFVKDTVGIKTSHRQTRKKYVQNT